LGGNLFINVKNHETTQTTLSWVLDWYWLTGAVCRFDTVRKPLNPLSLTPSRLPRFSANQQNFKTFSRREWNGKDPSRASTKEMTVKLEKVLAV
jgi:hypothetical protein